tara:strand:+ start:5323 stop:5958 length:636 start_codon:yes stop_codon:yes gene_type:complete
MVNTFLHIGCGSSKKEQTSKIFNTDLWNEVRLDINKDVNPDIIASITDMSVIDDNTYDAVYSSHNIEHVFPHEVSIVLSEIYRVLKDSGFVVIHCPDIQQVAVEVAKGNFVTPLYYSDPNTPISAADIMYGHISSIAAGNTFMAHKSGFTSSLLNGELKKAGFNRVSIIKASQAYALHALAHKNTIISQEESDKLLLEHLPYKEINEVLYK